MTETAKTCNGWTNYETWIVNLWLTNVEHWAEKAQDAYDAAESDRKFTREEMAAIAIATSLKDGYEEAWQEFMDAAGKHVHISSSVWADLMDAALSEVNWHEIAEHLIENVDKATEPEEEDEDDSDLDSPIDS